MFRWWRINVTKVLMNYLNRTYSSWRSKLKGTRKIRWDELSVMYVREVRIQKFYPETIGGVKEY